MSALGEMAAGMAHEINNPLAIVSGHGLSNHCNIDRDVEDKDKKFKDSALRITQTVNRIAKLFPPCDIFPEMPTPSLKKISTFRKLSATLWIFAAYI